MKHENIHRAIADKIATVRALEQQIDIISSLDSQLRGKADRVNKRRDMVRKIWLHIEHLKTVSDMHLINLAKNCTEVDIADLTMYISLSFSDKTKAKCVDLLMYSIKYL